MKRKTSRYIVKHYMHDKKKGLGWISIYDTHINSFVLNKVNIPAMFGSSTEVAFLCKRMNEESVKYDSEIGKYLSGKVKQI